MNSVESNVAFIAPGPSTHKENVMYIATSPSANFNSRPMISSRKLNHGAYLFGMEFSSNDQYSGVFFNLMKPTINITYVYGFSSEGFSYFLTTQPKNANTPNREYISKIVRICQNDTKYYSYTEIPIECVSKSQSIKYNLVQAAFLATAGEDLANSLGVTTKDDILYSVFSEGNPHFPTNNSALCIYSLKFIEKKFMENIETCFNGRSTRDLDFIGMRPGSTLNDNNFCSKTNCTIERDFCGCEYSHPIGGKQAIIAVPITTFQTRLTAITVAHAKQLTIAIVGTIDGRVKKVFIESATTGIEYKPDLEIDLNSAINADLYFDSEQSYLYVMTKDRVTKTKLSDCANLTKCPECLNANDSYCEWCLLEKSCISLETKSQSEQRPQWNIFLGVGLSSTSFICCAVFVIIIITEKRKNKKLKQIWAKEKYGKPEEISAHLTLLQQADRLPYIEKYEFPKRKLEIGNVLGEGHYGVVCKGIARGIIQYEKQTEVAVKRVKRNEVRVINIGIFIIFVASSAINSFRLQ